MASSGREYRSVLDPKDLEQSQRVLRGMREWSPTRRRRLWSPEGRLKEQREREDRELSAQIHHENTALPAFRDVSWTMGAPVNEAKRWISEKRETEPLSEWDLGIIAFSQAVWLRLPGGSLIHAVPRYELGHPFLRVCDVLERLKEYHESVNEGLSPLRFIPIFIVPLSLSSPPSHEFSWLLVIGTVYD